MLISHIRRQLGRRLGLFHAEIRESTRWSGSFDCDSVKVYYGHDHLPGRHEKSSGGIIKCQDLNDHYPNTLHNPSILYLVSSALPEFLEPMLRRARHRRIPLVWNQNGVAYPAWTRQWASANAPMKTFIHQADYVVYQSKFCKLSADHFLGERSGDYDILFNPVDTSVFCPKGKRTGRRPTLLLSGSHHEWYRVESSLQVVRALKDVPGLRLIIAGRYLWKRTERESLNEMRACISALGVADNVEVQGAYSQEQAVDIIRQGDILLHTKYNDPCPRLVTEALACGLPIVYSSSGGVPELVGSDGGIGIPAPLDWEQNHSADPIAMAEAVRCILANYERYASAARKRAVAALDVGCWIRRHGEIFDTVIAQRRKHRQAM